MSVKLTRVLSQSFAISSTTWNGGILTIHTPQPHNLFTGVDVFTVPDVGQAQYEGPVTVISGTSFSLPVERDWGRFGSYTINSFLPGQAGPMQSYSFPRYLGVPTPIQSYVTGTGGASYTLEVSLDGVHWIPVSSTQHDTVSGDTGFTVIAPGWVYLRPNIASIGGNTTLTFITGQ